MGRLRDFFSYELDQPPSPGVLPKIPKISLKYASNLDTTPAYRTHWILLILHINKDSLGRRANARNVSFRISLRWPIYVINPVDETKLSCYTSHRRSTTVSLETYLCIHGKIYIFRKLKDQRLFKKKLASVLSRFCNGLWKVENTIFSNCFSWLRFNSKPW